MTDSVKAAVVWEAGQTVPNVRLQRRFYRILSSIFKFLLFCFLVIEVVCVCVTCKLRVD